MADPAGERKVKKARSKQRNQSSSLHGQVCPIALYALSILRMAG
jgi:hypothetical protein